MLRSHQTFKKLHVQEARICVIAARRRLTKSQAEVAQKLGLLWKAIEAEVVATPGQLTFIR